MLSKYDKRKLKDKIRIHREKIKKRLDSWKSIKERQEKKVTVLENDNWGNRIIGHTESLQFCLNEIDEILNMEALKE